MPSRVSARHVGHHAGGVERLMELGEIDMVNVFIDGTKEEANANRYAFVWKKSVEKRKSGLQKAYEAVET